MERKGRCHESSYNGRRRRNQVKTADLQCAKPMVPVANRPVMEHIIELAINGINIWP